ncbi:MAG: glycosyltransferase family 39 protein [Alphaproteobacteria bacterium]|nr:glycosyltransferase family 39 protein [Alphaproteobacteria bacterium]
MERRKNSRILGIFLLLNLAVWSLIPLLRHSLPMDTMEAIVWGKYSWLGTTKHPPLSGILAYPFYMLFGTYSVSMYILSQLCVVLGIVYIYKLARLLVNEKTALIAALLQFGVIYYQFSSVEFNVNVVSLALWPAGAYYFWRAYTENRLRDWLLFGFCAALNLLNKYVGALQILSLAVFVVADKGVWRLLKNYKMYAAVIVFAALLAPHLYWMYEHNFEPLNYVASRSSGGKLTTVWRHLIYPAKFIGAQILFGAAAWLTYFGFSCRNKTAAISREHTKTLFIAITASLPIAVFAIISLVSGNALKSMWGFPCLYMLGIALCYYWPLQWNEKQEKTLVRLMFVWSMLFAVGYAAQCLLTKSPRFTSDCPQIVQMLTQKWQQQLPNQPLKYAGGGEWFVNMINLYADDDIKPMLWLSPKNNPWLDQQDFENSGALVINEDLGAYRRMGENYPLSEPQKITLEYHNYFGKTKKKDLFYGFYLPKENRDVR